MEANMNNYTFIEVEEKICEYCDSINSYDKNNICRNCGGNKYRINKVKVRTFKPTPKPIIESNSLPKTNSKKDEEADITRKIIGGAIAAIVIVLFIYIPILTLMSIYG